MMLAAVMGGVILAARSLSVLEAGGTSFESSSTCFGGSDFSGSGLSSGTSVEASGIDSLNIQLIKMFHRDSIHNAVTRVTGGPPPVKTVFSHVIG